MNYLSENFQKKIPGKKKFRFFFLFFLLSSAFWIITKLSNTYKTTISFKVKFTDLPDLVVNKSINEMNISLELTSSGFNLLLYKFLKNNINLSSKNGKIDGDFMELNLSNSKLSIQDQLYQNTTVNQIQPRTLKFFIDKLSRKKIPILPITDVKYKFGYQMVDDWKISPDSVWIIGPSNIIDSINQYPTEVFRDKNISKNITKSINLKLIPEIKTEIIKVEISAVVKKFTEKTFEVFLKIKNLPDTLAVKLFPQSVKSTFMILIDKVDKVSSSDFSFYCDFDDTKIGNSNSLEVKMDKEPKGVINVRWTPQIVDYLIRQ